LRERSQWLVVFWLVFGCWLLVLLLMLVLVVHVVVIMPMMIILLLSVMIVMADSVVCVGSFQLVDLAATAEDQSQARGFRLG